MNSQRDRARAMKLLNHRKPEHPPDIYFIRRNPEMLDKYLDEDEMESLIKDAAPKFRGNYSLFSLDPDERDIIRKIKNHKRNLLNPEDPFFLRCRQHF